MTRILFYIFFFLNGFMEEISFDQKKTNETQLSNNDFDYSIISMPHAKDSVFLNTGFYLVVDSPQGFEYNLYKTTRTYCIAPKPIITIKNIESTAIYEKVFYGKKFFGIKMQLDKVGCSQWFRVTKNIDSNIISFAFIVDNKLLLVFSKSSFSSNCIIDINRGDFTKQEVESLKKTIDKER